MSCFTWSQHDVHFLGLCRNILTADLSSSIRTQSCKVCVAPVPVEGPDCTGYGFLLWDGEMWIVATNACSEGCNPTVPSEPGSPYEVRGVGCS